jgi:maleate isomerase
VETYDEGPGSRAAFGLIALSTDRACASDVRGFLPDDPAIELFETRIPMELVATPASLRAQEEHLARAASELVPGSHLDAIGFGCTSAGAAIGLDNVLERIAAGRPGVAATTAIGAAAHGLAAIGATRIALLTPYLDAAHALVLDFFAREQIDVVVARNLGLDGDLEMNRLAPEFLIETGARLVAGADVDALFISCTGVRTRRVIDPLERRIGMPVLSSNQSLAWDLLRLAGDGELLEGRGRLLALPRLAPAAA